MTQITVAVGLANGVHFDYVNSPTNQAFLPKPTPSPIVEVSKQATPAPAAPKVAVVGSDVWSKLAQCESGGVPTRNSGNGYYGMFQFSASTWNSMGTGYSRADLAPADVQIAAAQKLQARSGWGQWPGCARKLGLL